MSALYRHNGWSDVLVFCPHRAPDPQTSPLIRRYHPSGHTNRLPLRVGTAQRSSKDSKPFFLKELKDMTAIPGRITTTEARASLASDDR